MTTLCPNTVHPKRQGRETGTAQLPGLLVCPRHRSLKTGPGRLRLTGSGFSPLPVCLNFLLLAIVVLFNGLAANGQDVEDTIRIKTRVVFLDALVKDKKTNLPISNLSLENFEVFDDGKPRNISYFTREGQARKPLALILILDLREDGAGRFLKQPEILKAMEDELARLPPGDEVAIMALDIGDDEQRLWLTEFTNDRPKLAAALVRVQAMCETQHQSSNETLERQTAQEVKNEAPVAASPDQPDQKPAGNRGDEIVETETFKGTSGAVITRKIRRDGTIDVTRVNKDGKVTIELDDFYDMAAAVKEATRRAEASRPNSQVSIVWISDGIAPIFFEDREATEQTLIRDNVIFNCLTVELRTLFKFLLPVGKPVAGWFGISIYGSAKYLAQRSGGEAVKVGRARDYGAGLSRIIGNLTARYSIGFTLDENESDDGRMHTLEIRVKAQDAKGKKRKLQVNSRQGYYMSTVAPKEAAVRAQ